MPEEAKKPHLPIGYWLKKADEVLTTQINLAQEVNDLTRTDWQVLNTLHETNSATRRQITDLLSPFADADSLGKTVDGLVGRDLIEGEGSPASGYRLTDEGRRVHADALMRQKEVRKQAVRGVSKTDYVTTVQVLQRLVGNLTDDEE